MKKGKGKMVESCHSCRTPPKAMADGARRQESASIQIPAFAGMTSSRSGLIGDDIIYNGMRKYFFILAIGILIVMPSLSFAAEEKFFEYATDVGTPIEVPSGSAATQEFRVFNDSISGVDVWFDNSGSAGTVSVSLLSGTNAVLATKSASVAHADPFYTGQRLHVKFNTAIDTTSGSWYKMRISSSAAKLRLYGIKRIQFVEHNAPYPVDYSIGKSLLDGEEQFAVYKFAIYEDIDTDPPIVTNASSTIASPDSMTVSFNASELVDRSLTYSPIGSGVVSTIGFSSNYSICFEGIYACSMTFAAQRNTVYVYQLTVRDSWGNEAYVDGTFESWKPGVPVPPTAPSQTPPADVPVTPSTPPATPVSINNASIVSVTNAAALVTWNTSRSADSVLTISTDPVGGQIVKTITDSTQELAHTIATGNILTANKAYYATIVSHTQDGAVAAQIIPFATLLQSATTTLPSTIDASTQQLQVVTSPNQQSSSISWSAPPAGGEPVSGYRVDIIDAQGNLFTSISVSAGTHTAEISGLAGGEYHAIVYADNNGVVEKVAEPAVITVRKIAPPLDTYELIKKPIVYVPAILFIIVVVGLYWYSRRTRKLVNKEAQ